MTEQSIVKPLTAAEVKRKVQCERIIRRSKKGLLEMGLALLEIRHTRLYREDFETFEDYCKERWNFGRARACQLIKSASVIEGLPKRLLTFVNKENKARELAKVAPEKRVEVLQLAERNGNGHVTARAITEAANGKEQMANGRGPKIIDVEVSESPLQEIIECVRVSLALLERCQEASPFYDQHDLDNAARDLAASATKLGNL